MAFAQNQFKLSKPIIIPIFLYRTSLISLDKEFVKGANKFTFHFMWRGKDKVKRCAFISDIEDVGLRALNLDSIIIETQRVLCCKKLANDQSSGWKTTLLHCYVVIFISNYQPFMNNIMLKTFSNISYMKCSLFHTYLQVIQLRE